MGLKQEIEKVCEKLDLKHPTRYSPKHLIEIGEERDELFEEARKL